MRTKMSLALTVSAAAALIGALAIPAFAAPPTEPPGQIKLHQVNVNNWDRTVAIDTASTQDGRLTLLAATKIVPAELGGRVATLTTTVTTDAATSHDFNLFASGFISRLDGETIARSTLFAPAHDGDPLLYAQNNTSGIGFCWDDKFYVNDAFVFTQATNLCSAYTVSPGSTDTYVTKIFGDNTVTTEVILNGLSAGTLHRVLSKSNTTQYQPILRTGLTAPPAGESGALTISNSNLSVK